jgi:NADPH:quinone reductase-like Zn-dependent oxidoreductase
MKLRSRIALAALVVLVAALGAFAVVLSQNGPCDEPPPLAEGTALMQAWTGRCYGAADVLDLEDMVKPQPGSDEILVRVHAAAVNPLDWHYMRGSPYVMRLESGIGTPKDIRVGVDFAGVVEAVGDQVTRFNPGDAVFGGASGAFSEYLTMAEDRAVAHKPANISFAQAAAVPIAGLTALQALRDKGQVRAGQKVLINGASGGVGTFAVQIAKAMGAEVHGVCSTRNVEMVQALGADRVWDYKQENYTESGERYDVIVDMVGNHSLKANRGVLKPEGRLVIVGGAKGDWIAPLVAPVQALVMDRFVDQKLDTLLARLTAEDLAVMADHMAREQVIPVIDRTYALTEVPDAIRYSESGRARGKIVIELDADAGDDAEDDPDIDADG